MMVKVAFRSPYDRRKSVSALVPNSVTLRELGEVGDLGVLALGVVRGEASVGDYPATVAGSLGLALLASCCAPVDAEALSGLVGCHSFAKQARIRYSHPGGGDEIRPEAMVRSLRQFAAKYGAARFYAYLSEWLAWAATSEVWPERIFVLLGEAKNGRPDLPVQHGPDHAAGAVHAPDGPHDA